MGVLWVGTSDIWLWILVGLDELDTHVVELGLGEVGVDMSFGSNVSPVIMNVAREG